VPKLVEVLETVTIVKPRIAVISNVDAMPHSDPAMIKQLLARQVTSPVQWETTVARLMERGMKEGYELGPGKVLAGIIKRIDKSVAITNVEV
jgi:[acyl-carrier-protein] S-malonyltransferase